MLWAVDAFEGVLRLRPQHFDRALGGCGWLRLAHAGRSLGQPPLELDLSFVGKRSGTLIADGEGERAFAESALKGGKHRISIKAKGGFVAVFK